MVSGHGRVLNVDELEPQPLPSVHRRGRWSAGGVGLETRVARGWHEGGTRVVQGWYKGVTRVVQMVVRGWYAGGRPVVDRWRQTGDGWAGAGVWRLLFSRGSSG